MAMNSLRETTFSLVAKSCLVMSFSIGAAAHAEEDAPISQVTDPHKHVDLAKFVRVPSVRRELKLTEAQVTELAAIEEETKKRVSDLLRDIPKLEGEERKAVFREIQEEIELSKTLSTRVFSEEQLQRAKQLALQFISRSSGSGFGILTPAMMKELKITDAQAQVVREKADEIAERLKTREAEMKSELEALRIKLQTDLIDSLDPMQRGRLKSLLGALVTLED